MKEKRCIFENGFCQTCGLSETNGKNTCYYVQLKTKEEKNVIYVFSSSKGLSFSHTRLAKFIIKNKLNKGFKYLGYTKNMTYPIKLNTGRILFEAKKKLS